MTDADGRVGWGEAPVLKDWGGEFGRYFGESPGDRARGGDAISGAGRHGLPARRYHRAPCADGPRAQGPSLCQGSDRDRGLRSRRVQLDVPSARFSAACCGKHIPVTHSIGLIGFEEAEREAAQAAQGRHPHLQDQGRRRSRPRCRDGVAGARTRRAEGRAVRRRQPGLCDAGGCDPHLQAHGALRSPLFRAAGRGHRAARRGGARDRCAGDGGRERVECPRRDRDHREARGADRVDLHDQAGRPVSRHGGRRGGARGGHRLQRQRLGGNRHRQPRQHRARVRRAGGDAVLRGAGLDAGARRSPARSPASTTRTT